MYKKTRAIILIIFSLIFAVWTLISACYTRGYTSLQLLNSFFLSGVVMIYAIFDIIKINYNLKD